MLDSLKDSFSSIPRRGIIAGSIMALAIGASFVVRYLRQRSARAEGSEQQDFAATPPSAPPITAETASALADAMNYRG